MIISKIPWCGSVFSCLNCLKHFHYRIHPLCDGYECTINAPQKDVAGLFDDPNRQQCQDHNRCDFFIWYIVLIFHSRFPKKVILNFSNQGHCDWFNSKQSQIKHLSKSDTQSLPCVSQVWTGLRFLAGKWWWANKEELKDSGGLPKCPSQQQHCGTVSKYDTKRWIIRDCSEKRNFVCYRYIV